MLTILGDFIFKSLQFLILVQCRLLSVASSCSNKNSLLVYFVEFHSVKVLQSDQIYPSCALKAPWCIHSFTKLEEEFLRMTISLDLKLEVA